jgi:outer membrane lipoprotein-sorting protein
MIGKSRLASACALFLPILLAGCSLFPTTRKLPVPQGPLVTQTATPEQLVTHLNERWGSLNTLTATVEIQATVMKTKEGVAKDYPWLHGHILMRKPAMLRVLGQLYGVRAFDMASDGKDFTLSIPTLKKAMKGSNSLKKKSGNALENLRPGFFLDSLLVRGLDPNDEYSVIADTATIEDAARKHLYSVPEYILNIERRKPGSQQNSMVRVVYFHRDDLQPYQQDIYDADGNKETQVFYEAYKNFESSTYPSMIIIKRPLEEIQVVLKVDDVKENQTLDDSQFVIKLSDDTKIQNLDDDTRNQNPE